MANTIKCNFFDYVISMAELKKFHKCDNNQATSPLVKTWKDSIKVKALVFIVTDPCLITEIAYNSLSTATNHP